MSASRVRFVKYIIVITLLMNICTGEKDNEKDDTTINLPEKTTELKPEETTALLETTATSSTAALTTTISSSTSSSSKTSSSSSKVATTEKKKIKPNSTTLSIQQVSNSTTGTERNGTESDFTIADSQSNFTQPGPPKGNPNPTQENGNASTVAAAVIVSIFCIALLAIGAVVFVKKRGSQKTQTTPCKITSGKKTSAKEVSTEKMMPANEQPSSKCPGVSAAVGPRSITSPTISGPPDSNLSLPALQVEKSTGQQMLAKKMSSKGPKSAAVDIGQSKSTTEERRMASKMMISLPALEKVSSYKSTPAEKKTTITETRTQKTNRTSQKTKKPGNSSYIQ